MAMDTKTPALGFTEVKLAKVTANTADTYTKEAYTAYAGLASGNFTPVEIREKVTENMKLKGEIVVKQGYDISFVTEFLDLNMLSLINGTVIANTGTGLSEINSMIELDIDSANTFAMAVQTTATSGTVKDVAYEFYCVQGKMNLIPAPDKKWTMEFKGTAYYKNKPETSGGYAANSLITKAQFTALT